MPAMDDLILRVTRVDTLRDGYKLTNASGFFYMERRYLYLVTSRHVVINEPTGHRPDQLSVQLHRDDRDLTLNATVKLDLYHRDGSACWLEHPLYGAKADLVAIPVFDPGLTGEYKVSAFTPDHLLGDKTSLPLGRDLLVVGFPLGFYDTLHNLPVARSATLASHYPTHFKGNPYFLTDARLHRGSSGAPVVGRFYKPGADVPSWFLLGIHSSSLDVTNRDPEQDQPLGLNVAYYASLLREMVSEKLSRHREPEVYVSRQAKAFLSAPIQRMNY